MNNSFEAFEKRIRNRIFFKQFLLLKLPAAFFAGLTIESLSKQQAVIAVKQQWFNKNPFHSIYFAVLTMAAEMSTGVLCMGNVYKLNPSVSMLVVKQESIFHKKATGKILFYCNDGNSIAEAIEEAVRTNNAVLLTCYAKGINSNNEMVAECNITWSFKPRSGKTLPLAG